MHMSYHDMTSFQQELLTVVAEYGPTHGLHIKDVMNQHYDEVNHGRLYPNLDTLAEKGLIEKQRGVPDMRSNSYAITEDGKRVISEMAEAYAAAAQSV